MTSYVIGDIHGCREELASLLGFLPLESGDRVVLLGDYVDRGPDPKGVISCLIEWQKKSRQEFIFLKGNHEDMFLSYLRDPAKYKDLFIVNGGGTTLASYGINPTSTSAEDLQSSIPSNHVDFFKALRPYYLVESFLCVHAGIHPLKPLDQQAEKEILWIRDEFIQSSHSLPYTVLFGHTPCKEVFFDLPYKIGLDTGLVYGNRLSCIDVRNKVLFQIERHKTKVIKKDIRQQWNQKRSFNSPA